MPERRFDIYKCVNCESVIEIEEPHDCTLKCGNAPMTLMTTKNHTGDAEVHIPIITATENGYLVKVSALPHPMTNAHYIEFIELNADGRRYKTYLSPSDEPQYEFPISIARAVSARIYCNLHGVWEKTL
ncbi:MAG: hypothetical protein LBQ27_02565 [Clostridiales bacterium]|jgi:superoxide reductase|nr:hypothetical protein [Clostridiales bacterium]